MVPLIVVDKVEFKNIIKYPYIEIQEGNTTFISGDSGCGKSTLLKILNGAVSPTGGEIKYKGKSIESLDTVELRKKLLLAGQSVYLFDTTIEENFAIFYEYRGLPKPSEEKIREYLSICCGDFPLNTPCGLMSGGERQRVYIAIFLSFLPEVFMLDEPTSALDAQTAFKMLENLTAFCKEKQITLIAVSHDKALAQKFADDLIILKRRA